MCRKLKKRERVAGLPCASNFSPTSILFSCVEEVMMKGKLYGEVRKFAFSHIITPSGAGLDKSKFDLLVRYSTSATKY